MIIFKTMLKYITSISYLMALIPNKTIEAYVLRFSKLTGLKKLFYNDRKTCNAKYFEMLGQLSFII